MKTSHLPDELGDLLEAFCLDELTPAQAARLEQLVFDQPENRVHYLRFVQMHALALRFEGVRSSARGESVIESPLAASSAQAKPLRFLSFGFGERVAGHASNWLSSPKVLVAAVSSLLVAYFGLLVIAVGIQRVWQADPQHRQPWADAPTDTPAVARLLATEGCHWETTVVNGEHLAIAPLRLKAGVAEIRFESGATVVLQGPAEFIPQSPGNGVLNHGKLVVHVPKQAVGFTINTPTATVTDLGTEFGVSVDERGATETQVFRGAVEIETLVNEGQPAAHGKQKRKLVAGEAARIDITTSAPQIQSTTISPNQFIRQLPSQPSPEDHEPSAYAKSVIEQTKPVLYWNFDNPLRSIIKDLVQAESADSFMPLSVKQPGPRPSDGFTLMGLGNRAASVNSGGNVAFHQLNKKLHVPTDAYSVQIWFNSSVPFADRYVQHLLGRANSPQSTGLRDSLFVGGNYGQIAEPGYLGFLNGNTDDKKQIFVGATLLRHDHWYLATLVRDGDHVRVYLDGVLEIDAEAPWQGGDGEHISFGHRADLLSDLGLFGRFDEIAVWDRALNEKEVLATYRLAIDQESHTNPGNF